MGVSPLGGRVEPVLKSHFGGNEQRPWWRSDPAYSLGWGLWGSCPALLGMCVTLRTRTVGSEGSGELGAYSLAGSGAAGFLSNPRLAPRLHCLLWESTPLRLQFWTNIGTRFPTGASLLHAARLLSWVCLLNQRSPTFVEPGTGAPLRT